MDWSEVDERMAGKILRQGEIYLQGTLAVSTAADQHAATLAGIFSAAAIAVLAATLVMIQSPHPDTALIVSGFTVAFTWFIGSSLCVAVVWPSKFHLAGNEPKNWWPENVALGSLVEAIGGETENYQERIEFNTAAIRKSAKRLKLGAAMGCAAPIAGFGIWLILRVFI